MTKVRVYEVARELGLPNRELVERISALGIEVRNHMSALDPSEVERVKKAIAKSAPQKQVEERIRPTVVRRRSVAKKKAEADSGETAKAESSANGQAQSTPASTKVVAEPLSKEEPAPTKAPSPAVAKKADTQAVSPAPAKQTKPPATEPVKTGQRAEAARPETTEKKEQRPIEPLASNRVRDPEREPVKQELGAGGKPLPASVRFAHANLPPGVVARGKTVGSGVGALSETARSRIVSEHSARRLDVPRRRELGRAALGPVGRMKGRPGRKKAPAGKKGKQTEITVPSAQKRVIRIEDHVQLQTLAGRMGLKATEVLMKLMQLGMSGVHINSTLDADTAKILASEFNYEVENVARSDEEVLGEARGTFVDNEEDRTSRPPVVTVMGHVDHGKTSLLDKIRSARVASGEAGGITQHIGAHRVTTGNGTVVFLDTPGHEAFTAMRARGAQSTDIVVLVVAADDGVMPQTKEAIHHAKEAGVPIIVAVNKIDKPEARPEQVKTELSSEGLQPEEWGGDTMFVECSAISGQGIDTLLENLTLQAEILELKANPKVPAEGIVLEAYLDRGRGPVANVLVRNGVLRIGDPVVVGPSWGRVRALTDDLGKQVREAGPATPVEVLGLSEMPGAGDKLHVVQDAKKAQEVAALRKSMDTGPAIKPQQRGLDELYKMMQEGEFHELKLVVKADVQGSIEAIKKALTELSTDKVKVQIIHSGVGGITENDVLLASASSAIIIGFNVRPAGQAATAAKNEGVDIRKYSVIYEAVNEVKAAMAGLLAPTLVDKDLGTAEIRQVFTIPKVGAIAGCYVTSGKIIRSGKARLIRDSVQIWQGDIDSLRRFKEDTKEVTSGYECGIGLKGFNDINELDVIECYEIEEIAATLD